MDAILSLQEYHEKIVKISKAPGSDDNFGFSIRGGREHGSPIIVEHVTRGKQDIVILKYFKNKIKFVKLTLNFD